VVPKLISQAQRKAAKPGPQIFTAKPEKFYRSGLCGAHHPEMILQ
jgi:hypothetical protein